MCVGVGCSVSQPENIWSLRGKYPDQTNLSAAIIKTHSGQSHRSAVSSSSELSQIFFTLIIGSSTETEYNSWEEARIGRDDLVRMRAVAGGR